MRQSGFFDDKLALLKLYHRFYQKIIISRFRSIKTLNLHKYFRINSVIKVIAVPIRRICHDDKKTRPVSFGVCLY